MPWACWRGGHQADRSKINMEQVWLAVGGHAPEGAGKKREKKQRSGVAWQRWRHGCFGATAAKRASKKERHRNEKGENGGHGGLAACVSGRRKSASSSRYISSP